MATKDAGRLPSWVHVSPKSVVCADHVTVPLLTSAVQSATSAHSTLVMVTAPVGVVADSQCLPASSVVTTTPLDNPFEPTAMHSDLVGQATPFSSGV